MAWFAATVVFFSVRLPHAAQAQASMAASFRLLFSGACEFRKSEPFLFLFGRCCSCKISAGVQ